MSFLVTVYWLWFGVSLAILARRGVRKLWRPPTTDAGHEVVAPQAPTTSAPHPVVEEPRPAVAPRPERSPVAGTRTSLAEALAGIRMPFDLAPLSHLAGADPTRRLVLTTNRCPAEMVDAALTEELERLGFGVERTGPTELLAHRDGHAVSLHVRPIGFAASNGPADPSYPTAPAGSVVVDLQLR